MTPFSTTHKASFKSLGCDDAQIAALEGANVDADKVTAVLAQAKAAVPSFNWAQLLPILLQLIGIFAPKPSP